MDETVINSNSIKRISVSRNHPSAFVVGAGNFVAAALIEKLLENKTQIIAFDRMDSRSRNNLKEAVRYKHFYFLGIDEGFGSEALEVLDGDLPEIGYGFFFCNSSSSALDLKGFINLTVKFQESGQNKRGLRCVFVSNIGLYKNKLGEDLRKIKALEVMFAKAVAEKKLNGRIVRLAAVYGPKMSFEQQDSLVDLVRAALTDKIREGGVSDEFSSRAIYIDRAVDLLMKSVMTGSTAMKIYDGSLVHPIKVSELRQILLDVDWSLDKNIEITKLPPWLSPNLEKTVRELNWLPESDLVVGLKKTVDYFKKHPEEVEMGEKKVERVDRGSEERSGEAEKSFWDEEIKIDKSTKTEGKGVVGKPGRSWGSKIGYLLLVGLVGYGLIYPAVMFGIGVVQLGWNLKSSKELLNQGKYDQAIEASNRAVVGVSGIKAGFSPMELVAKTGVLNDQIESVDGLIKTVNDGVVAIRDANVGFANLQEVTTIISGENNQDPGMIYKEANVRLRSARESLTKVELELGNVGYTGWVSLLRAPLESLRAMVLEYELAVGKGEVATVILPPLTGVGGESRSYLVVLQNNKSLRPAGGVVEAVARIDFANGKLKSIESKSSDELDAGAIPLAAPSEIHQDLGAINWSISDASVEPDFPSFSRVIQLLYQRDSGKKVDGVVGMDLTAFNELATGLGGVNSSNGEVRMDGKIIDKSLFDKLSGGKVYSDLLNEMLKKMFFLTGVNWSEIGMVLDDGLRSKDIQLFVEDKGSFTYIASQNWGGVMVRQSELAAGEEKDFLSVNDTVVATGSAKIQLDKKLDLKTMIGADLGISHVLRVGYTAANIDGAVTGIKSRVRIYVPGGNKLDRVVVNGVDVSREFKISQDYGRIVFSGLIEIAVGKPTNLEVDYSAGVVKLADNVVNYRLDVIKQAGSGDSDLNWSIEFPEGWKVSKTPSRAISSRTAVSMRAVLNTDLAISTTLSRQ